MSVRRKKPRDPRATGRTEWDLNSTESVIQVLGNGRWTLPSERRSRRESTGGKRLCCIGVRLEEVQRHLLYFQILWYFPKFSLNFYSSSHVNSPKVRVHGLGERRKAWELRGIVSTAMAVTNIVLVLSATTIVVLTDSCLGLDIIR